MLQAQRIVLVRVWGFGDEELDVIPSALQGLGFRVGFRVN